MTCLRRSLLCCALAACMALVIPAALQAQTLGAIQGFITDENSAPIPGVQVDAVNQDTGARRTTFTEANGFYLAQALQSGTYTVTTSLEGLQTLERENIKVFVGQTLDVNLTMGLAAESEVITVTSEAPQVETSRSTAASYVSEREIAELPISGRDFKEFALLTPTVQADPIRGFITMSGQRGIYSGLNIDGTSGKSAFFAYGRGGEATENDGLVVAQDSVKEFQVIVNGFAPEYGENSGGYINVITKAGTNNLHGSAFYYFRDEGMLADIPSTPLDASRGVDGARAPDEFKRDNYGLSLGGPISQDRTHYFFSYDQTKRDEPFTDDLRTRGFYDAVLLRGQTDPAFLALLEGYVPNSDGIAAPDELLGRTATGLFVRSVDNMILFGKIDHRINDSHTVSLRNNFTDYERTSTFKDEESLKVETTNSTVGSLLSIFGSNTVNEFRFQYATDDLDRLSQRVGEPIEALIRYRGRDTDRDQLGKFDFLPILVEEKKTQIQNNFSYLFNDHDLKFGLDYQSDNLKQLFAGSRDGRYDFASLDDFLANDAIGARIYFGNVQFPNYDETQDIMALYAQDSWKPNSKLTLSYGVRWQATDNPGNLEHIFPEGRDIPDDKDNIGPRVGFAYALNEDAQDVIRGGVGLFHGRTPTLLFASQVQENGLFPNFGRVFVSPGDSGFVPLGSPIPNQSPPLDTIPATSFVDPNFEDPETLRFNVGYERQLAPNWSAGIDLVYAEGDKLQTNVDSNRTLVGLDSFGRPVYTGDRPDPTLQNIFVRQSIGESEYTAATIKFNRRFSGRYQLQGHYTWSQDEDTDSNERSATTVTISDISNPRFDYGLSQRDVEHRLLISGIVQLPWEIKLSGIAEWRSGTPYTALDPDDGIPNYPGGDFNGPRARAVINGQLVGRNTFRDEDISRVDLRLTKFFSFGRYEVELFGEVFNLFDENSFAVIGNQLEPQNSDGSPNSEFGIPDGMVTDQRSFQIGARFNL